MNDERAYLTISEMIQLQESRRTSAEELVANSLRRIRQHNPSLNAFRMTLDDQALGEARDCDEYFSRTGTLKGPLHGIPVAIKDENDVAGTATTFGGAASTVVKEADSEVVRRFRSAGAIIVGKTLMPEFGIWPFTETSAHGYTRNPWNLQRSTAGSSGGTAAAVAAGLVPVGLGGDGGGSIRLPASFCGLFGLKPQRGRVSTAPNPALWRSLGVLGPLTRTVLDSAIVYDVLAGSTSVDRYSAQAPISSYRSAVDEAFVPLRIAVSERNPSGKKADNETLKALHRTAQSLANLGHRVEQFEPRYPDFSLPFAVQLAGGVGDEAAHVDSPQFLERRTQGMLKIHRLVQGLGTWAESKSQGIARRVLSLFDSWDLLLMPTTPSAAVSIGQLDGAGLWSAMTKALPLSSFTSIWNVCGNPAAAIPTGFSEEGLPLSVQMVGPENSERRILQVAAQLERVQPWAVHRPQGY